MAQNFDANSRAINVENLYKNCGVGAAETALRDDYLSAASTAAGRAMLTNEIAKLNHDIPNILPKIAEDWLHVNKQQDLLAGAHKQEQEVFDKLMESIKPMHVAEPPGNNTGTSDAANRSPTHHATAHEQAKVSHHHQG